VISQEILSLFLKYRIPPAPRVVARLRLMAAKQLTEVRAAKRPNNVRVADWEKAQNTRTDAVLSRFDALISAAILKPKLYRNWHPDPDDWIKLAVRQAIAHAEPGFDFIPPKADRAAEMRFHREGLINYYLRNDLPLGEGGKPVVRTIKDAAELAVKHIENEVASGSIRGEENYKQAGAAWAAKEYGQRRGDGELPPALTSHLACRSHEAEMFNSAIRATAWPADANGYGKSGGKIAKQQGGQPPEWIADLQAGETVTATWPIPVELREDGKLRISFTKLPPDHTG
jgi:hypothetical protein